jgi:hypothetical protein
VLHILISEKRAPQAACGCANTGGHGTRAGLN